MIMESLDERRLAIFPLIGKIVERISEITYERFVAVGSWLVGLAVLHKFA
jgi:hypothetical protein